MTRTADRKPFGDSFYYTQQDRFEQFNYIHKWIHSFPCAARRRAEQSLYEDNDMIIS